MHDLCSNTKVKHSQFAQGMSEVGFVVSKLIYDAHKKTANGDCWKF